MSYSELADLVSFRPLERPVECLHRYSPFKAPWSRTVSLLARELRMLGAKRAVMQVDLREQDFRIDGIPRSDRRAQSPGVVLSLDTKFGPLRYEVGTYSHWEDNVRAIALGLEALRAVDRYGVTRRGEQYAGWKQLPTGSDSPSVDKGRQIVEEHGSVREAIRATHPDKGGSVRDFEHVMAYRESVGT